MSKRYLGGVITANPATPTGPYQFGTAPGMWTTSQQLQYAAGNVWPVAGLIPNYIEDMFSTYLYTGTSASQTITNGIDLAGKGGLTWIKNRNNTQSHYFIDSVRGISKLLNSNNSFGQGTDATNITSYNANGFTVQGVDVNASTYTYASWTFRKQPKFFDVVTYTGNGVAGRTVAHNLGSSPGFILIKRTDAEGAWIAEHTNLAGYLILNSTAAQQFPLRFDWSSSNLILTADSTVNASGGTYVAYLFAHDAGGFGLSGTENVVSCGSYTGNGSAAGPDINLGYEPQWVLIKNTSVSASWRLMDTMRGFSLSQTVTLLPDVANAEFNDPGVTPTATGFKLNSSNSSYNSNGSTFIYIAIRRGPMAVPMLGTTVFAPVQNTAGTPEYITSFPVDAALSTNALYGGTKALRSRLTGTGSLSTNNTNAEVSSVGTVWDYQNGWGLNLANDPAYYAWNFRRAPGFFDEVCWTANGSAQNIAHNLGVAPELMIFKGRSVANNWYVGANFTSTTYMGLYLDATNAGTTGAYDNAINAQPTAAVFRPGSNLVTSGNTVVTYLFATCAGISKVGSYTGTGTTLNIDCGFTTGARFVLVKNISSAGSWYIWDSARGMVSGTDPSLQLNVTSAQINGDSIFTASTGFQVVANPAVNVNFNGSSYIFLAIS